PDTVAHVRIRRVVDSSLPQVPEVRLVLFDLSIPAMQIQGHFRHVMNSRVSDVPNRDAGVRITLSDLEKPFSRTEIGCRRNADVLHADLLEKKKVIVGGLCRELPAELDSRRVLTEVGERLGVRHGPSRGSERTAENPLTESSPLCIKL